VYVDRAVEEPVAHAVAQRAGPDDFHAVGANGGRQGKLADPDVNHRPHVRGDVEVRSEEHTSELQSLRHLVCRLLLEKKNNLNAIVVQNYPQNSLFYDRYMNHTCYRVILRFCHYFDSDLETSELYCRVLHSSLDGLIC